jgi:ribosome production factor 1
LAENIPKTLDNTREFDPSILTANPSTSNLTPEGDSSLPIDESAAEIDSDPFASYFTDWDPSIPPKVLITTSPKATKITYNFCEELVDVFPGSEFIQRKKGQGFEMGKIAGWAADRGYGKMVVVNENVKKPSKSFTRSLVKFSYFAIIRRYYNNSFAFRSHSLFQTYLDRIF